MAGNLGPCKFGPGISVFEILVPNKYDEKITEEWLIIQHEFFKFKSVL